MPQNNDLDFFVEDQDYENGQPLVYAFDVNGDGVLDYLIKSEHALCGTGGCTYLLIDGKTFVKKGEFAGNPPMIADSKVNKHFLFLTLKYDGPDHAKVGVYQYNGLEYVFKKSIALKKSDIARQLKLLRVVQ